MKKFLLLLLAPFGVLLSCVNAKEPLEVGEPAPKATALNQDGEPVVLEGLYAAGDVLVYFYPKADTRGCTAQACSLRDDYEKLTDRGLTVVGVSTDDVATQKAFQEKHELPFELLADTEREVMNAFRVPVRPGGLATRQAFLVRDGRIVWRDLSASTAEQAADVIAALDSIEG